MSTGTTKKKSSGRAEEIAALRQHLIVSAFDFFQQAVRQHNSAPKYAMLHLATSVELFLKARLMAEHWTLIVSPKTTPKFDDLKTGAFTSVTPAEAIERLNGAIPPDQAVSKQAATEFSDLAKERNKIAHFFHDGLATDEKPSSIIQRQCRVWFHLHRLLSQVWQETFTDFAEQLKRLDETMRKERKFLKAIFEEAETRLNEHRKSGKPVIKCPVCGFRALTLSSSEPYTEGLCLVCRYQRALLNVECPECEKTGILLEHGYDHCPKCDHAFEPTEVRELVNAELPTDDTGHSTLAIYCCNCQTDEVGQVNGKYVCFNCMDEWDEISQCDWCSELNTGDLEDSFLRGCAVCDGHIGHHRDRD